MKLGTVNGGKFNHSNFKKSEKDPTRVKDLEVVTDNIKRMRDILKDMVHFSKQPKGEKSTHELNQMIHNVLSLVKYHKKMTHIKVKADLIQQNIGVVVDPRKLEQVLLNILLNAADAILEASGSSIDYSRSYRY